MSKYKTKLNFWSIFINKYRNAIHFVGSYICYIVLWYCLGKKICDILSCCRATNMFHIKTTAAPITACHNKMLLSYQTFYIMIIISPSSKVHGNNPSFRRQTNYNISLIQQEKDKVQAQKKKLSSQDSSKWETLNKKQEFTRYCKKFQTDSALCGRSYGIINL